MSLYIPRPAALWAGPKKAGASESHADTTAREACRSDFGLFLRTFFPDHLWGEYSRMHHDLIADEGEPDRRGKLEVIAAPRGNAKTVVKVLAKVIHSIVYGYQPFTVIIGYSAAEAEGKVKDIRDELLHNEDLTRIYGRLVSKGAGIQGFETANGCMVLARGRGGQVRGLRHGKYRPTHIILDDVEDLEACQSQLQREKTIAWFKKDVLPAKQSGEAHGGNVTFIGTVLHEDSLLAHLLTDPTAQIRRKYRAVVSFAERQDLWDQWRALYCNLDDQQAASTAKALYAANEADMLAGVEVLWPAGESYYDLMIQRIGLTEAGFNSEKQNEPFDPERQVLDPSLCPKFRVFTPLDPEWPGADVGNERFAILRADGKVLFDHKDKLKIIAFMDPALGRKQRIQTAGQDYTAIVVCAQDLAGYVYCLDAWVKKRPPSDQIAAAFRLHQQWGFEVLYLETVGFQELLKDKISTEQANWENQMRVVGVGQHTDKQARITSLEPYFRNGWLHLRQALDHEFINQIRLFPTVHDDAPDALEGAVSRLRRPKGYIGVMKRDGIGVV